MNRFFLSAAALLLGVGCAEHPNPVSVGTGIVGSSLSRLAADSQNDWVMTPEGWFLRECVHEIPNGASLDPDGVVHKDGKTYTIPQCPYMGSLARQGAPTPSNPQGSLIEFAYDSTGHSFEQINALWAVPPKPPSLYVSPMVFYAWPGLESGITSGNVLQPVMEYGYDGIGGGNYWYMRAWQCALGTGNCNYSSAAAVDDSDVISGIVKLTGCAGSTCRWDVRATDWTKNGQVLVDDTFPDGNPPGYYWAYGGAMEGTQLLSCSDYPPNGVFFVGIGMVLVGDSVRSHPNWHRGVYGSGCELHVIAESTYVSLYDTVANVQPPGSPPESVTVTIAGPSQVPANKTCTWTVSAGGGTAPYVYSWLKNGQAVAGDSVLEVNTGNSNFVLSSVAVDSLGRANGQNLNVTVGGVKNCAQQIPRR